MFQFAQYFTCYFINSHNSLKQVSFASLSHLQRQKWCSENINSSLNFTQLVGGRLEILSSVCLSRPDLSSFLYCCVRLLSRKIREQEKRHGTLHIYVGCRDLDEMGEDNTRAKHLVRDISKESYVLSIISWKEGEKLLEWGKVNNHRSKEIQMKSEKSLQM